MEPNQISKPKMSVKDFFLNLGAIVALYTVVVSLLNLLFTVINVAYPQVSNGYNYYSYGSQSISWPVAILIIFFPILILLMWLLEKDYSIDPEKKNLALRKWLSYITLFVSGMTLAVDLVMVLYYFIDGQELTVGFLLKVASVLVVSLAVFMYYISDIRNKLTHNSRKIWRVAVFVIVLASIGWGFSVLGSPRTQRLIKYDTQKVTDLQNINSYILSYVQTHSGLPGSLSDLAEPNAYFTVPIDAQSGNAYEYKLIGQSAKAYELCAEFNKDSKEVMGMRDYPSMAYPYGTQTSWSHPAGHYCFSLTVPVNLYPKLPM